MAREPQILTDSEKIKRLDQALELLLAYANTNKLPTLAAIQQVNNVRWDVRKNANPH